MKRAGYDTEFTQNSKQVNSSWCLEQVNSYLFIDVSVIGDGYDGTFEC